MKTIRKWEFSVFLFYVVIAIGTSVLYQRIHASSQTLDLFVTRTLLLVCALLIVILFLAKVPFIAKRREWLTILVLSFYVATTLVFLFRNTVYGLNGVEGDAQFITASITKYAHYSSFVDFSYRGLSAFYPPFYFYVMGKLAWLLHIEPYKIVKWGPVLVALLWTLLAYIVWAPLVNHTFALLLTGTALLTQTFLVMYKPYEWMILIVMIPWWFLFVQPIRGRPTDKKGTLAFLLLGGWIGSLIFQTYYYYFFIFGLYLLIQMAIDFLKERSIQGLIERYKPSFYVLALTFLFSLLYLAPLLSDFIEYGVKPLQNRWFKPSMLEIPTYNMADITHMIDLIGLVSLFWFSYQNEWMKKLLILLGASYLWLLLGHMGIEIDKPLLHVKVHSLIHLILIAGFSYLVCSLSQMKGKQMTLLAVLLIFTSLGQEMTGMVKNPLYQQSFRERVIPEVAVLKKMDVQGKVFLTDQSKIAAYLPVFSFFTLNRHTSHHSSQRDDRVLFLQGLSQFHNPEFVAWMLTYNRYNKVDFVYLHGPLKTYVENYQSRFPLGATVMISFDPTIFKSAYFRPVHGLQDMVEIHPMSEEAYQRFGRDELEFAQKYVSEELRQKLNTMVSTRP